MGEKRGNTGKLKYDFNTAWACEIQLPSGNWCRTLETNFRSYNGPRRITRPTGLELGNPFVETETFDYEGPYYFHNTNTLYNPEEYEKGQIVQMVGFESKSFERRSAVKTTVAKL